MQGRSCYFRFYLYLRHIEQDETRNAYLHASVADPCWSITTYMYMYLIIFVSAKRLRSYLLADFIKLFTCINKLIISCNYGPKPKVKKSGAYCNLLPIAEKNFCPRVERIFYRGDITMIKTCHVFLGWWITMYVIRLKLLQSKPYGCSDVLRFTARPWRIV